MNDSLACKWTQSFYSVIGFGTVQEITDHQHKIKAFNQIMMHYSGKEWDFDEGMLNKTRLWKITIEQLTGKKSLDKTTL
jgi:nitroimidazol reductase NimA-like FMN-containing flavoprotein (pyridoxamine 5'-phosphate oxidase superfamily)